MAVSATTDDNLTLERRRIGRQERTPGEPSCREIQIVKRRKARREPRTPAIARFSYSFRGEGLRTCAESPSGCRCEAFRYSSPHGFATLPPAF